MNPNAGGVLESPVYRARVRARPGRSRGALGRRVLAVLAGVVGLAWIAGGVALYGRSILVSVPVSGGNSSLCIGVPAGTTLGGVSGASSSNVPATSGFERTLGDPATSGLSNWPGPFDVAPKLFDVNGDGVDEIIAQSNDTKVYVFSASTGRALAALPTSYPPDWYIERVLNGVEAAVLHPGEAPSLIVTDHAACVAVWRFVPPESDSNHYAFEKMWERRMNDCFWNPGMDAKPTVADLDRDGTLEILVQTEEIGFYALAADGTTRWKHCWAGGNSAPVAEDLDGDGRLEAIIASDSGFLSVLDGASGSPLWTFDAADPRHGVFPASVPVSPTIAELDGQPPREVLFTARHAPKDDAASFPTYHMAIFAVHQNRTTWQPELLWMRQPSWANPLSYTRLIVQDVDADGAPDIFGMDWNTIGHLPGHWERLGPAHVFRLTAHGEDVWVHEVDAWWSNKDLALGDVDGDGGLDLLANGPREGTDGLWRLSVRTGEAEAFLPVPDWKLTRGPLLADLRHDGSSQLVFPVEPVDPLVSRGAILMVDLGDETLWRGLA